MFSEKNFALYLIIILLSIYEIHSFEFEKLNKIYEIIHLTNPKDTSFNPYREFNHVINSMFFSESLTDYFKNALGTESAYYTMCYLRDLVAGTMVYWLTAGVWHIAIYNVFVNEIFTSKNRPLPSKSIIIEQILLSQSSLFIYAGLPVISEWLIENKFTKTYFYIDEIGGWGHYFMYFALYIFLVEFGIYWVHRTLHNNKFLYKYVHGLHHKYNRPTTLTPWTSIAFNPLDGILQVFLYQYFNIMLIYIYIYIKI